MPGRPAITVPHPSSTVGPPGANDLRQEFERTALPVMPVLYRVAVRMTRRPEAAADLVQETMLRAYRTFGNFAPGTNAKAWLFTILYSIAANTWRREQREPDAMDPDALEERFSGAASAVREHPEIALIRQIDSAPEVEAALGRLPEPFRSAVLLVDMEELTYEEAAAALECPVGTLRSRLHRARRQLFVELADYAQQLGFRAPDVRRHG
jgi:RNA polymerase sigma-70 factor (ECF subfamily)